MRRATLCDVTQGVCTSQLVRSCQVWFLPPSKSWVLLFVCFVLGGSVSSLPQTCIIFSTVNNVMLLVGRLGWIMEGDTFETLKLGVVQRANRV